MTLWIWNIAAVREIFSEMLARLPANGVIDDYRGVRLTRSLLGWDLHFAFALRVIITFRCGGPARCMTPSPLLLSRIDATVLESSPPLR
jgi:hypothetical protein